MKEKLIKLGSRLALILSAPVINVFYVKSALATDQPFEEGMTEATKGGLSQKPIAELVINLGRWLLYVLAGLCVIAFAIAGIIYLTAAGDEERMERAKRAMMYSVVGIVVGLLGLIIANAAYTWLGGESTTF